MQNGRALMLEGIRLPGADRPSAPIAAQALDALRQLAMTGPLTLTSTPPKEDRYGRLRVQAFADVWLQVEMLKRGLARVAIMPDRQECSPDFYDAETEARKAGRGLWALPDFAVRKAQWLVCAGGAASRSSRVMSSMSRTRQAAALFSISIPISAKAFPPSSHRRIARRFATADPALEDLVGHDIRIRGTVMNFNGRPEIALFNPRQIEILK